MKVSQFFTASLTLPTVPDLYAVEGDDGRIVVAELYAGAEPWVVPEGVSGRISYALSDGTQGCYEMLADGTPCCVITENRVAVTIAPELCRNDGDVEAVIVLHKGERQISTFPFRLHVAARPGKAEVDPGPDAVPAFAGKLYYGDGSGNPAPLGVGDGLAVADGQLVVQEDPDAVGKAYVDEQLAALRADLTYEPIAISSISIQPSVAQMGAVIENPTLVWTLNREPVSQRVSGVEIGVDIGTELRRYTVERVFEETSSVVLVVTDERGATDSGSATMNFYNGVYCGNCSGRSMPTDEELRNYQPKLQPGRGLTIEATADLGEYLLYAIPSRYGTPEFWCNGLQGGFEKVGTLLHTNRFGYAENYDVWISEADRLRGLTITVK